MARGQAYADALAAAQRQGLAERDPSADVDGYNWCREGNGDFLALVLQKAQLRLEDVNRTGISSVAEKAVSPAALRGPTDPREVTTVDGSAARVEPVALDAGDPLWGVDGTDNAVVSRADPLRVR